MNDVTITAFTVSGNIDMALATVRACNGSMMTRMTFDSRYLFYVQGRLRRSFIDVGS